MIEINGSIYPDNNQIIKTACSLSAVTGQSCRVFNIKKELKKETTNQCFSEINTLARFSNAGFENNFSKTREIRFFPGKIDSNLSFANIKIEKNQNIVSTLQTLLPAILFLSKPIKINFDGGITDGFSFPTLDHFRYVFLKILEKSGIKSEIKIIKKGYYPEAGAKIEMTIHPLVPQFFNLTEKGQLKKILIISGASESLREKKIAERQLMGTREILNKLNLPIEEKVEYYNADCPGSQICLAAEFEKTIIGSDSLIKMAERIEDVGKKTALSLLEKEKKGICLDEYSTNQILIYLALAKEKSSIMFSEINEQNRADIEIIEKFLKGKFKIKNNLIAWQNENY